MKEKEEMYYGYIYLILDQKYNKVYVGQKKGKIEKSLNYFGSGKIIKDIIKKRGSYFLKKIVLGICYSKIELNICEIECIQFFNSTNKFYGYNILDGGSGILNYTHTETTKKVISDKQKKIWSIKFPKTLVEKECIYCKNIFKVQLNIKQQFKIKFCSRQCYWDYMKNKKKNFVYTWGDKISKSLTNKKLSKSHIENISKSHIKNINIDLFILIDMYKRGESLTNLSQLVGVSYNTLRRRFINSGINLKDIKK